jgi:transcriptional regulator with XRE-family HTH domain
MRELQALNFDICAFRFDFFDGALQRGKKAMKNQHVTVESEGPSRASEVVPIPPRESELASRLRDAIGAESQAGFARRAGVGESLLRQYLGGAMPSTDRLVLLADAANVNIEWLAAGRGPKVRLAETSAGEVTVHFSDIALLRQTIETIQSALVRNKIGLPPDKYAELVSIAYEMMLEGATPNSVARVIQFKAA